MSEQYRWFVGIDWATERHEVCIVDGGGQVVDRRSIEHSGAGIAQLIGYLKELTAGQPWELAAGVETPRVAIVESLIEQQFHVYSLNPKQMDRFRIGTRLPVRRMTGGMPWSSQIHFERIATCFIGCAWMIHG